MVETREWTPPAAFDYDGLDPDARAFVQDRRDHVRVLGRRAGDDIVAIGNALTEVKARLPHGRFGAWLRAEFDWSHQTARRFMRVAERFPQNAHGERFEVSALYLLAADATPSAVRELLVGEAAAGRHITSADVKHELFVARRDARLNDRHAELASRDADMDPRGAVELRALHALQEGRAGKGGEPRDAAADWWDAAPDAFAYSRLIRWLEDAAWGVDAIVEAYPHVPEAERVRAVASELRAVSDAITRAISRRAER